MFIAVIFLIHPWLGTLAIFSAPIILTLALLTELASREPYRSASEHSTDSHRFVENSLRLETTRINLLRILAVLTL